MESTIIFIEPFYGGSHKQLIDTLTKELSDGYDIVTLPAKKWPWRARCSSLRISQLIPVKNSYKYLFCSSVLSLSELLGLRPDLQKLKKIVFFHENQLIYPKQQIKERDFQFGYNQITTCLAADTVIFNSDFNMKSFLSNINKFIKMMPDCKPVDLISLIEEKSIFLYFPINFSQIPTGPKNYNTCPLHIIWPHRWEFDKGPEEFFQVIFELKKAKANFKLSILGETFADVPDIFHTAKEVLNEDILHWGYVDSKDEYYKILNSGHVVVSTAKHEFFGVAMLEAVHCGCFPLAPNRLVYPELYDTKCLYKDETELLHTLKAFCENPNLVHEKLEEIKINLQQFSTETLISQYTKLFN